MSDEKIEPPPIAMLPEQKPPPYSTADDDARIFGEAAVRHAQLKRQIEASQVEATEAALREEGLQQKIEFLEKEAAELRLQIIELQNNVQTLATQRDADLQFFGIIRKYLDARDIKSVPKKARNGNGNKKDNSAEPNIEAAR